MRFLTPLAVMMAAAFAAGEVRADVIVERFPQAGPIDPATTLTGIVLYPEDRVTIGQTITVQNSGDLFQFDVLMARSAPLGAPAITAPFSYSLSNGVDGALLATGTFLLPGDLDFRSTWVTISLDETIRLAAGSDLFITLNGSSGDRGFVLWQGLSGPDELTYAGGTSYRRASCASGNVPKCDQWQPSGLAAGQDTDLGYRLYIDTSRTSVPEPGALGVVGIGMLALGLRSSRRRPARTSAKL